MKASSFLTKVVRESEQEERKDVIKQDSFSHSLSLSSSLASPYSFVCVDPPLSDCIEFLYQLQSKGFFPLDTQIKIKELFGGPTYLSRLLFLLYHALSFRLTQLKPLLRLIFHELPSSLLTTMCQLDLKSIDTFPCGPSVICYPFQFPLKEPPPDAITTHPLFPLFIEQVHCQYEKSLLYEIDVWSEDTFMKHFPSTYSNLRLLYRVYHQTISYELDPLREEESVWCGQLCMEASLLDSIRTIAFISRSFYAKLKFRLVQYAIVHRHLPAIRELYRCPHVKKYLSQKKRILSWLFLHPIHSSKQLVRLLSCLSFFEQETLALPQVVLNIRYHEKPSFSMFTSLLHMFEDEDVTRILIRNQWLVSNVTGFHVENCSYLVMCLFDMCIKERHYSLLERVLNNPNKCMEFMILSLFQDFVSTPPKKTIRPMDHLLQLCFQRRDPKALTLFLSNPRFACVMRESIHLYHLYVLFCRFEKQMVHQPNDELFQQLVDIIQIVYEKEQTISLPLHIDLEPSFRFRYVSKAAVCLLWLPNFQHLVTQTMKPIEMWNVLRDPSFLLTLRTSTFLLSGLFDTTRVSFMIQNLNFLVQNASPEDTHSILSVPDIISLGSLPLLQALPNDYLENHPKKQTFVHECIRKGFFQGAYYLVTTCSMPFQTCVCLYLCFQRFLRWLFSCCVG